MKIEQIHELFLKTSGICTDTRKIEPNCFFIALKGDKFNANEFAEKALEQGAAYALIDEADFQKSEKYFLVDNCLETLQKLANFHRNTFKIPIIALTGSNGKTTNKELLNAVLAKKYKVHATKGNLNNHIGVPLTLLSMPADTDIVVIEMGANHQKEIELLCSIAEPSHGFITNLGKAHLEGFGGEEGIRKGKGELFDFLKKTGGIAFVNENDSKVKSLVFEKKMMLTVFYGNDEHALKMLEFNPVIVLEDPSNKAKYTCQMGGIYNFDNMQTAYAVGTYFDVNHSKACEALAAYNPENNRSQIIEKETNSILMDAYNANPSSMEASIQNFATLKTEKKKIVFLGDMFELGEDSQKEHEALGRLVSESAFETVVLFGDNMSYALKFLPKAYYFTDKFSLHNWINDKKFQDSFILIKGSRGVALETILNFI